MGENNMKWSLYVKNLGKIREATVNVSRITMFTGDNNSGKSYLMSLLYTICTTPFYNLPEPLIGDLVNKWVSKIQGYLIPKDQRYTLCEEDCLEINNILNDWLSNIRSYLMSRTFNYPMYVDDIKIIFNPNYRLTIDIKPDSINTLEGSEHSWDFSCFIHGDTRTPLTLKIQNTESSIQSAIRFMFDVFLDKCLLLDNAGVMFLPTSRTGFMLTFKELSATALTNLYTLTDPPQMTEKLRLLTKPSIDFLKFMSTLGQEVATKSKSLADYIEEILLDGHLNIQTEPFILITYTPKGTDLRLPLSVTSAIVTELAPLVIALRYSKCKTLFIEEPESCLHPKLQWLLAKVLVRLSKISPIIITTHSDILTQCVNNLIRLNYNSNKNELMMKHDYTTDDLLSPVDICCYHFSVKDEQTNVKNLPCGKEGVSVPTFDSALSDMYAEILDFTEGE